MMNSTYENYILAQDNHCNELSGGEIVIEFLKANGYTHIFGIPGRNILPFYDTAYRLGGMEMIVTSHEQGGSFMATCFSHMNDKGCCAGMTGPGTMNLLNGVAAAYADSIPLMVFGGQVAVSVTGKYAIQESTGIGRTPNQLKIFETVTKCTTRVEKIEDLLDVLRKTYLSIHSGRKGPGFIEIPQNILDERTKIERHLLSVDLESASNRCSLNPKSEDLTRALSLIKLSSFPVLLLGNGASISKSEQLAKTFIDKTNMPFVTTLPAKGLINEDHELCLGCIGIWGQRTANEYVLNRADTIVAIGTSFQELSTLGWRTFENKKIIRIDIDQSELNRNCNPEIMIHADAYCTLDKLNELLTTQADDFSNFQFLRSLVQSYKDQYGYYETFDSSDYPKLQNGKVPAYEFLIELGKTRGKDDVLVFDAGENAYFSQFLIKSYCKKTYLVNAGLGSMGFSTAGSVGVSFACPNRNVISVVGDGGFLMNENELATAAHYGKKVIWCILNNGILGTQKNYQRDFCDGRYIGCHAPKVDIENYAISLGVHSVTVNNVADFRQVFLQALESKQSTAINIIMCDEIGPKPPFFF
jgi:acetolactate synthase I/II/III large subunit